MITHKTISLADQVFERIENGILDEKYERGTILTENRLSEELGVSRTPVREALRRLEQEHLVEDSKKGSIVVGITPEDAEYIFIIRKSVEGFAAAVCAKKITDEQLADLTETLDLQNYYLEKGNLEKQTFYDTEFHKKIYRYTGSAVIEDTLSLLHRKAWAFRRTSIIIRDRGLKSVEEHRAILDAISAHDPKKARDAMSEHVVNALKHLASIQAIGTDWRDQEVTGNE